MFTARMVYCGENQEEQNLQARFATAMVLTKHVISTAASNTPADDKQKDESNTPAASVATAGNPQFYRIKAETDDKHKADGKKQVRSKPKPNTKWFWDDYPMCNVNNQNGTSKPPFRLTKHAGNVQDDRLFMRNEQVEINNVAAGSINIDKKTENKHLKDLLSEITLIYQGKYENIHKNIPWDRNDFNTFTDPTKVYLTSLKEEVKNKKKRKAKEATNFDTFAIEEQCPVEQNLVLKELLVYLLYIINGFEAKIHQPKIASIYNNTANKKFTFRNT